MRARLRLGWTILGAALGAGRGDVMGKPGLTVRVLGALAATLMGLLTACAPQQVPLSSPPPVSDQASDPAVILPEDAFALSEAAYFRKIEASYRAQGRLRTDSVNSDAPFRSDDLADNFLAVAFFDEFSERGGRLVAGGGEARLHRWTRPIRLAVEFGPSVPQAKRNRDMAEVSTYLVRLSRLTGLSIQLVTERPNYLVLIDNPGERDGAAERILSFAPGTSVAALRSVQDMRRDIYCTVFSYSPGRLSSYDRAVAVIRAELPDLMRRACIHEEIAQGLGLINDVPTARPSIFNDNEEFALLTRQDELMLRILYDARLRPGMSLAEARPIVEIIAAELMPGQG